jgi:hypothetical protein
MNRRLISLCVVAGTLLAACSGTSSVDTPVVGRLQWFSFIGGADIRKQCVAGAPARYRFVYNAVYSEQVRVYDVTRTASGAEFGTRISSGQISLLGYFPGAADPWNARARGGGTLDDAAYLALIRRLEADGFGAPTDTRTRFPSWDHYWLVSACADGRFHINGWRNGTPAFAALGFPELLFAKDDTEIAIRQPQPNPYADYLESLRNGMPDRNFDVQLTPTGTLSWQPF